MRGTKHANEAIVNKLKRELAKLLESPRARLSVITWKGKLHWNRNGPVTNILRALESIVEIQREWFPFTGHRHLLSQPFEEGYMSQLGMPYLGVPRRLSCKQTSGLFQSWFYLD
jgi:hypothetical protein